MTAVWTVHTARGRAGTITDTGNGLVASPQSLQSMADTAARRGGAAYLDGYSNGYVWTERSGHTVKAAAAAGGGEDDPKAPVTGPAGQPVPPAPPTAAAWPGWAYDLTLASVYTDQVTQAFRAATTQAGHLLRDWWAGRVAATRAGLVDLISDLVGGHVGATLRRLWTEAWYLGHRSARGVAREEGPDWGTWTPGDFEAAQIVATAHGLQTLLAAHGVTTIRAIAQTRMQALATEISDAVEHGDSWESLAARLEQILRVPQRAPMIARTEIARAVSAATVDQYREHGVARAEWAVAPDERVCPVCRKNEAAGAVPAGSLFPSGNESPPAHPNCRCALTPAEVHGFDITGPWPEPVAKSAWQHELRGPDGKWEATGDELWHSHEGYAADATSEEADAARQWWYGPGHQYTNAHLRGKPSTLYPDEKAAVDRLTGLVARAPAFTRPVLLHRGVDHADHPGLFGPVGSKVGKTFTDPGLMSATADESMARNGYAEADGTGTRAVLHIHAPAGARALRADPAYAGPDVEANQEYTFPAGTALRVIGDQLGPNPDGGGQVRHINATVERS